MKRIILIVPYFLIVTSCGYTILREDKTPPPPLPDLTIIDVKYRVESGLMMDNPDTRPWFYFSPTITNLGDVPFNGLVALAWADNSADVGWGAYPNFGFPEKRHKAILPGDTITVEFNAGQRSYVPGSPMRFLLVTQEVMPIEKCKTFFRGAADLDESSYQNNLFDYIMQ